MAKFIKLGQYTFDIEKITFFDYTPGQGSGFITIHLAGTSTPIMLSGPKADAAQEILLGTLQVSEPNYPTAEHRPVPSNASAFTDLRQQR